MDLRDKRELDRLYGERTPYVSPAIPQVAPPPVYDLDTSDDPAGFPDYWIEEFPTAPIEPVEVLPEPKPVDFKPIKMDTPLWNVIVWRAAQDDYRGNITWRSGKATETFRGNDPQRLFLGCVTYARQEETPALVSSPDVQPGSSNTPGRDVDHRSAAEIVRELIRTGSLPSLESL